MWDGFLMLLSLSTVMALASFLVGSLPLSLTLSQRQLRFITGLGTGVLVGTALIVIIPEGIETIYSAGAKHVPHARRQLLQRIDVPDAVALSHVSIHQPRSIRSLETVWSGITEEQGTFVLSEVQKLDEHTQPAGTAQRPRQRLRRDDPEPTDDSPPSRAHEGREPHAYVGISLVLGFILMYLIDVVPWKYPDQTPSYRPLQISLSNLSRGLYHHSSSPPLPATPLAVEAPPSRPPPTSIGLIIHAVADGIALGASTTGPSSRTLGMVVFLAIMLHKAPAAFGLTSVLLKLGVSKRAARGHLAVFSLAAPVGAFGTWVAVNLLGRTRLGGDEGMTFATGRVLLFSGGTFLYVAFHSMQESQSFHDHDNGANGYVNPYSTLQQGPRGHSGTTPGEAAVVVLGMLLPLVTQIGHAHAH